jgi:hypothetical protein
VKVWNIAGALRTECTENCHSIKKSLGSPSGTVLLCASAKSTLRCANNFWGRRKASCVDWTKGVTILKKLCHVNVGECPWVSHPGFPPSSYDITSQIGQIRLMPTIIFGARAI